MKFTLVTTCFNEICNVELWRDDVCNQTRHPDEIQIVDAGSNDGTLEVLEWWVSKDSRVKLEVWYKCNVAQGRNKAIANTDAEIIVSTDMGCRLDKNWFENICKPFTLNNAIQVVAGNYAADESTITTVAARAAYYLNHGYHPTLRPGFLPSSRSIAYRKSVWETIEGYPEDLTLAADDYVFALQLDQMKLETAYAHDAICYWGRHSTLHGYWKEAFVYGKGNGEAGGIIPLKFMRPDRVEYSKFCVYLYALYISLTKNKRAYYHALKDMDFMALLILPVLVFGNIVNNHKGYSEGVKRGLDCCQECRERVRKIQTA